MTENMKSLMSLLEQVMKDYISTGKEEYAAHTLQLYGLIYRESGLVPVEGPIHPSNVEMAVKALNYIAKINPTGDDFDRAVSVDGMLTAWLLARRWLHRHLREYGRVLANARCVLSSLEDPEEEGGIPDNVARSYIHNQPPWLFMNESWNYGPWRAYYAEKARSS